MRASSLLATVFRLATWFLAGITTTAIFVGRTWSSAPPVRTPRPITTAIVDVGSLYPGGTREPQVLDADLGRLEPICLGRGRTFAASGFSPWRDAAGHFEVVAFTWPRARRRVKGDYPDFGVVRLAMPGAEVLNWIPFEAMDCLGSPPCWSPEPVAQVAFAGNDGSLYRLDFEVVRSDGQILAVDRPVPSKLAWRASMPEAGGARSSDLTWPADPRLGGRLLVALYQVPHEKYLSWRLWWLRLDPQGAAVVEAAPLLIPGADGAAAPALDQRFPTVATASDGSLVLAYLAHKSRARDYQLKVAPIKIDPRTGAPFVIEAETRTLADGCSPVAPVFSTDGRWVHVIPCGPAPILRRINVGRVKAASPPYRSLAATGGRTRRER
jgi:hypothetical protein